MKNLSEHLKHRVVGGVLIVSLLIIFLPAFMKQSNERIDAGNLVLFRLPHKPKLPEVPVVDKKNLFKAVKVASISLPPMVHVHTHVSQAVPLSNSNPVEVAHAAAKPWEFGHKHLYAVQLASFNQEEKAKALVLRLKNEGFAALALRIDHPQGALYQVVVGQLKQRNEAVDLQKQLVNNTHLNGMIIKTKVS